ncbi:MAG: hypothetical protein ACJ0HH_04120 [Candidatus Thalassarchaeum sp.]
MTDSWLVSRVLVLGIVVALVMPTAAAHGANTFSFILRNETAQPGSAQVLQNDTLVFYNIAGHNRSVLVDVDGDGEDDFDCVAGPYNSTGNSDECYLWLDPANWSVGDYEARVMSNGSLWNTISFTVQLDNHTEILPPDGFVFIPEASETEGGDLESVLLSTAVLLAGAAAFIRIVRNVEGDKEE